MSFIVSASSRASMLKTTARSLFLTVLLAVVPAWGATYYVSSTGGATYPNCTTGSPCPVSAMIANATEGDTWVFKKAGLITRRSA